MLERKNGCGIEKVSKKIDKADNNIFKALAMYNKVYKRKFTVLGTPIEMAKKQMI